MATKTWSLYASDGPFQYQSYSLDEMPDLTASVQRLTSGLSDRVDLLSISNGNFKVNLLPTRGMGIWNMSSDGESIGWNSPIAGPVHPSHVNLTEPSGLGWLDGFDEFVVRCGLESNGAPDFDGNGMLTYPLHGRIANRPAKEVKVTIDSDQESIVAEGIVEETRFHFAKLRLTTRITVRKGASGIELEDSIQNFSGYSTSAQMLYHINVGEPLLDAGSQIVAPVETLVPRTTAAAQAVGEWNIMPEASTQGGELVYFMKLHSNTDGKTPVMVHNAAGDRGLQVLFDSKTLPCFTLWKNPVPSADGYVIGLEPATNYPNPRSFEAEQGRVVPLKSGESVELKYSLNYLSNSQEVETAKSVIHDLQAQTTPKVYDNPQPGWSPID